MLQCVFLSLLKSLQTILNIYHHRKIASALKPIYFWLSGCSLNTKIAFVRNTENTNIYVCVKKIFQNILEIIVAAAVYRRILIFIRLTSVSWMYIKSFSELSSGKPVDIIIANSDKIRLPCLLRIKNACNGISLKIKYEMVKRKVNTPSHTIL